MSGTRYQFGGFTLDSGRGMVVSAGREVKLRPKVYDALLYILENRGRLIGKEELIHALWPDAFVTGDSLVQCMLELRRALDDREQEIVRTVPRRGYVFTATVTSDADVDTAPDKLPANNELLVTKHVPGR
jgi:DNA-binding winged helix-turn-helix (wHTH) protein